MKFYKRGEGSKSAFKNDILEAIRAKKQSYRRNKNATEKNEDKNQNKIQKPHDKIISSEAINEDIKKQNSSSTDDENWSKSNDSGV